MIESPLQAGFRGLGTAVPTTATILYNQVEYRIVSSGDCPAVIGLGRTVSLVGGKVMCLMQEILG